MRSGTFIRPGMVVWIVGVTLTSLSTIVVILRYYSRWYRMGVLGSTDHLMFVALLLTWGNTVINYYQDQTSSKFRPSYFRKPEKRPLLEGPLHGTLLTWYIYRMSYGVALCFVKLSILFFYRSIASHATFRRMVYGTITFVILYTIATTFASAFQCQDPRASFDISGYLAQFDGNPKTRKGDGGIHTKCYDPMRFWVFTSAVNLLTDVVIMLLPIPTLLGLRVPMTKRLALVGIFSVGIMAIIASCVRMWVMALWSESPQNAARFGCDLLLWGQVETNSGIVSASVPFLRLFFRGRERELPPLGEKGPSPRRVRDAQMAKMEQGEKSGAERGLEHYEGEKKDEEGASGSPGWGPFITVPASLSSRGSGIMEPVQAHMTV